MHRFKEFFSQDKYDSCEVSISNTSWQIRNFLSNLGTCWTEYHIVHVVLRLTVTTLLPTLQVHYLPMWYVGLPNIFCPNHSTFTHFSILTILRLFLNKNISPLRRRTPLPPVSRRKSRSKKHFTYLSDISRKKYTS